MSSTCYNRILYYIVLLLLLCVWTVWTEPKTLNRLELSCLTVWTLLWLRQEGVCGTDLTTTLSTVLSPAYALRQLVETVGEYRIIYPQLLDLAHGVHDSGMVLATEVVADFF